MTWKFDGAQGKISFKAKEGKYLKISKPRGAGEALPLWYDRGLITISIQEPHVFGILLWLSINIRCLKNLSKNHGAIINY